MDSPERVRGKSRESPGGVQGESGESPGGSLKGSYGQLFRRLQGIVGLVSVGRGSVGSVESKRGGSDEYFCGPGGVLYEDHGGGQLRRAGQERLGETEPATENWYTGVVCLAIQE